MMIIACDAFSESFHILFIRDSKILAIRDAFY